MDSVILSGPSGCKIRRKYPFPSFNQNLPEDCSTSFYNNDPALRNNELNGVEDEEIDPYLIWRRNAPFLYDAVSLYNLDWPSLVVEFMTDTFKIKNGSVTQRLLLGTHTSGSDTEFAMVAELKSNVYTMKECLNTCENFNQFKAVPSSSSVSSNTNSASQGILDIKAKIVHEGEINRISQVPGAHFLFVTQSNNGTLYLFDYSKHPSNPRDLKVSIPQMVLQGGHSSEGYGLAWNSTNKLVSCASDGTIALWDLNSKPHSTTNGLSGVLDGIGTISPISTYNTTHTSHNSDDNVGLNDIEFINDNVVLIASDDTNVHLMDLRTNSTNSTSSSNSTNSNTKFSIGSSVNCLSLNKFDNNYFVCGCDNGKISLFDTRMGKHLLVIDHHKDSVNQIEFNSSCCGLFATCSNDSSVCIFDLACKGDELRFVHQGHKDQVNDISWTKLDYYQSAHLGFTIASVSQDNLLQCFTPNYFSL
ncbi:WD domain G-beta repeat protein [Theileria parva strain Muguga]|uniref:Chromatin assembly factor 1 subunit, putative n=1 Tax=Theileria parva TaxID=5875 RepID=Q4N7P8_THEPA|nr:WD domain G-beta repeat protein [Theileria parva strain Muguga]EAN34010.1 WD domain G-beta repeat protein [Theileria parva strain Muguga]|eukprot:XP_766293.1 chromatin assembly factor 1 subunit [Theileria parva strain Muguga]